MIKPKLPEFTLKGWQEIIWPSLAVLKPIRFGVDENIQQVFELITEKRYDSVIEYQNRDGKNLQKAA